MDPKYRLLYAHMWSEMVNRTLGLSIIDVNCAFKLIRKSVLDSIVLEATGASINAEMLKKLSDYRLIQLPVEHLSRVEGKQSGANPKVVIRALWELIQLMRNFGTLSQKP